MRFHGENCMRRAIASLLIVSAFLGLVTSRAWAQSDQLVNGIGLIDYSRAPDFKIGSWVKYHVTGHSSLGHSDDYVVTVAISGEERLWGEPCFWVETTTEQKGGSSFGIATLMSYSIFNDSLPALHMQYYTRKNVT